MDRQEFVKGYTKVLTSAWSDEDYAARLQADPAAVVAEAGLEVPEGATVEIVASTGGEGDLDDQVKIWEEGLESGGPLKLYVPDVPQVEPGELSDAELEGVAGGTDYCCCCSPCCTCT
jgi:hypothetical protein